jgi:plastocyanin
MNATRRDHRRDSRRVAGVSAIVAASLLVVACGGGGSSSSTSAAAPTTPAATPASPGATSSPSNLSLAAKDNQLLFTTNKLTAGSGKVTIAFTNNSSLQHNFTLVNSANTVLGKTPTFAGGSKSFSTTLKPGTYTYYCSVPGHRQAGMQGTLTVK